MKRIAVSFGCLLLLGGAGNYNAALGLGDKPCKAWTAERKGPRAEVATQWFLGYISGINLRTADMIIMDEEGRGLLPQMDTYCAAHPADNVMAAATALIMSEYQARLQVLEHGSGLKGKRDK